MTKTEARELVKQHNNTIYGFDENVANGREKITLQEWFKFSQEKQPLIKKGYELVLWYLHAPWWVFVLAILELFIDFE